MTGPDRYAGLRAALKHEYSIDEVLREDDESAAYLARDLTLDRRVLVRALSGATELPHAARVLASLSHPNIPAIHHARAHGDVRFVVMEHIEGPALESRLRDGALPAAEVLRLGHHILGALETAHAAGVAHTDIVPRNVIIGEGRYVLDGFDRASMANEELVLADLTAVRRLLAEAAGGTLPRQLKPLERVLNRSSPAPTASACREALRVTTLRAGPSGRRKKAAVGALIAAAAVLGIAGDPPAPPPPGPAPRELAVLPLEVDGGLPLDPLGASLAHLIQLDLEDVPGLSLTPRRHVIQWWETQSRESRTIEGLRATRELRTHWVAHGLVERRPGDILRVRLSLYDSSGTTRVLPEVRGPAGDLAALGDSLTLTVLRAVAPRFDGMHEPGGGFVGVPLRALKAFLQGESAFARDAWALAQVYYEQALDIDPTFALADWRRFNVMRWRRLPEEPNLAAVYRRHAARLRPRDRAMIQALLEPDLATRFDRLDSAMQLQPHDGYARLLQAEELFHRGPLAGRPLMNALGTMDEAVARDSSLALAHDHLVVGHVRLGHRQEARAALELRRRVGRRAAGADLDLLPFLELVYDERFVPWRAWMRYRYIAWREDPEQLDGVRRVARLGTYWLDLPHTQLRYCDLLLSAAQPTVELHATAHEGKGLALFAMGRLDQAFAEFDSAAALLDTPEARLQQAEWRLVPHALGVPGIDTAGWELRLEALAVDSSVGRRAAWALGVTRLAAGDTLRARRWIGRLSPGDPLRVLIDAGLAAAGGAPATALAMTDSARAAFQAARPPDVFARTVVHLQRAYWWEATSRPDRADGERLWYEASNLEGWPEGLAHAGEVDGAMASFARLQRARALARDEACGHLARLRELWSKADPALLALASEAEASLRTCRS